MTTLAWHTASVVKRRMDKRWAFGLIRENPQTGTVMNGHGDTMTRMEWYEFNRPI